MAYLNSTELAQHMGAPMGHLRVWVLRGKLLKRPDGLFDTEHPVNKIFIAQKKAEYDVKPASPKEFKPKPPPPPPAEHPPITPQRSIDWNDGKDIRQFKSDARERATAEDDLLGKLVREKEQLDIEKKREDLKLARAKNAKISGETIPTDLVVDCFSQFGKSTVTSFMNGADALLLKIAAMKGLDRAEYAKLKGELKKIINESAQDAIKTAKAQINNIVEEYSMQRSRGEKA
jgi:hypothetical protein